MEEAALLQEVEDAYQVELLRLPRTLRQMNWLQYYGRRGGWAGLGRGAGQGGRAGPPPPRSNRTLRLRSPRREREGPGESSLGR